MAESRLQSSYLPLRDFTSRLPGHRPGTRTHVSTLIRFATDGAKGLGGGRVKLRAIRIGNRWLTTEAWFADFLDALTTGSDADEAAAHVLPTPSAADLATRKRAAKAAAELDVALGR